MVYYTRKNDPDKTYPYMLDGMTMYLASGDKGKAKAAKKSHDAAYWKDVEIIDGSSEASKLLKTKKTPENKYLNFVDETKKNEQELFMANNYGDAALNVILERINNPLITLLANETTLQNNKFGQSEIYIQDQTTRYVGNDGVRFRSAPGMSSVVLGLMKKGTEVEYTGRKTKKIDGHLWAEVVYNGKKGWIAADYLKISNPNKPDFASANSQSLSDISSSKSSPFSENFPEAPPFLDTTTSALNTNTSNDNKSNITEPVSRYVSYDNVRFRSAPGLSSYIISSIKKGTEVKYTGKKTEEIDGHLWAEVLYDGKIGWVAADLLKISKPKNSISSFDNQESTNKSHTTDKTTTSSSNFEKVDLSDYSALQTDFQNFKISDTDVPGDFDGWYGLQCVDLTNWFINKYTTLGKTSGNGCDKVSKIASLKDDLEISIIPSAPAVFSIAPGKPGPGVANASDPKYGHTGIVLDVKIVNIPDGSTDPSEYTYAVTYFHTYSSLSKTGQNSSITTKNFIPNEGVTYVNIGNYIK